MLAIGTVKSQSSTPLAGAINNGMLKLTVPDGWSHPLMENFKITSTGSIGSSSASDFGGYYVGDPDDESDDKEFPETNSPGAMGVLVDNVNLDVDEFVEFVYMNATVQPGSGNPAFVVAVDGGAGPGEGAMDVTPVPSDALEVSVGDASSGSGTAMLAPPTQAVTRNSLGNELIFIYTPDGTITDRTRDFRVEVPRGWSEPTDSTDGKGTFTVTHRKLADGEYKLQTGSLAAVEKIGPFENVDTGNKQMAGRLHFGMSVGVDDQIVFTYENADAPDSIGAVHLRDVFWRITGHEGYRPDCRRRIRQRCSHAYG